MDLDDLMLAAGKAHPGYQTDAASSSSTSFGPTSTPWATRSILQHHQQSRALGDLSDPWLQTTNRIVAGIGVGISTSLLIMRIYTKTRIMSKFWWDDIFVILAWIFSMATQGLILAGYAYSGIGVHIWNSDASALATYPKTVLAASSLYLLCLGCAKLALLMFYYTLLNVMQFWKYIIYVVGAAIIGYTIALFLALIFACHPIQRNWDPIPQSFDRKVCIRRADLYLATAITNTVSDVILILIPIQIVWHLHVSLRRKIGIAAIFGVGCLTIITSVIRLATIMPLVTSKDQPYKMALASLLIFIEANFVIICGCLPYLRRFLRRHAPRLMGEESVASSESRYQTKGVICRRIRLHTNPQVSESEQTQQIPSMVQGAAHSEV